MLPEPVHRPLPVHAKEPALNCECREAACVVAHELTLWSQNHTSHP